MKNDKNQKPAPAKKGSPKQDVNPETKVETEAEREAEMDEVRKLYNSLM